MNPNLNPMQMSLANAQQQQQQLAKQAHQQKLAFTESQILEQAKRSLESSHYTQLNNSAVSQQQQKFQMPPKFDMNPALKQLRDIADARSNVGGGGNFPGINPNAFNNSFNKSKFLGRGLLF